jgi:hypothetical protein
MSIRGHYLIDNPSNGIRDGKLNCRLGVGLERL